MLPVLQEVPHHSVGPGLMLNCAKRQHAEPWVNLYHVSSPFRGRLDPHMYTIRQTLERFWSCMLVCKQTRNKVVMYPPIWVKGTVVATHTCWSKSLCMTRYFSHTFTLSPSIPLSLSMSLTHSLTISQCCYWNVCVLVRTVKLMNDQPWQIHSPDPGAAGEETNGKLGLWRSQS